MLAAGLLVATVMDIRSRRIPNIVTLTMAIAGIGLALTGMAEVSWQASVVGLAVGIALMLPGHLLGATGAGDVKLMGAVGAIVGLPVVVNAFLYSSIVGGMLALALAISRRRLSATITGTARLVAAPGEARESIRSAPAARRFAYGPAIAVGSALAVWVM